MDSASRLAELIPENGHPVPCQDAEAATIAVSRIAPPSHDIKPDRKPEDILQKLESIRQQGVLTALFGFWRADGMFELIDGLTRYLALLMGGFTEAPIREFGRIPAPDETLVMQVTCNLAVAPMSDLQLADAITYHQKLTGGTQAAACKALGISASRGCKIMAMFTKLCPDVQALLAAGQLPPRAAYALSRLPDHKRQFEIARKAVDLPMAVETVETIVDGELHAGRKPKPKPLKLRIDGVQMVALNPTLDGLQGFFERGLAAVKKLAKDGDGPDFLPARMKGA